MKKKCIYRKLKFEGKTYYQLYKIVNVNEEKDIKIDKPGHDVSVFAKIIEFSDSIDEVKDLLYTYYQYKDGELSFVTDPFLIMKLLEAFYKKYQDFDLVPKNKMDVDLLNHLINKEVYFQENAISETLNIIKSNLDILDSSMNDYQKRKLKHNILIYGPKGFGKSTFMELLCENIDVPCVLAELSSDTSKNLTLVINGLITSAMGNIKSAENGVVFIKDNFLSLGESLDDDLSPLMFVEDLLGTTTATLGNETFDLSKITYVLEMNTATNNADSLYDEGFNQTLFEAFNDMICFSRLTKDEIKSVILNHPNSSLVLYRKLCQERGKGLIIETDFLDTLINRAYYDIGGLSLINDYIEMFIKTRWGHNPIILNKEIAEKEVEDSSYLVEYISSKVDNDKEENVEHKEKEEQVQEKIEESDNNFKIDVSTIRESYRKKLEFLRGYIKGQDDPLKNILYHALINDVIQNSDLPMDSKKERINHVLIRGGTGTGKSYISKMIAKVLGDKPYAEVDSKRYTETGWSGKNIDDMLIKLYYAADCDLEKAQKGILFLDEIDKLACNKNDRVDISRGAVQESLLKLMEGTIFDLELKEGHDTKIINFDTRELAVIAAGAFEGLNKIRDARLKKATNNKTIGFQNSLATEEKYKDPNYTLQDMQEFGMHAQLLRRIPAQYDLNELKKEDYRDILLNSKSSAFKIKLERLEMFGIKITYDDEFIDSFTERVSKLGFGVSGIAVLTEYIFANFETKLLENDYEEVILNKECVTDPSKIVLVEKRKKVLKKDKQNRKG